MFVHPSQSYSLVRLFALLSQGEKLAHHSAKQQSKIMFAQGNISQAKFLKMQARQELFHARIFDSTMIWLGGCKRPIKYRRLEKYAVHLEQSLKTGAMTESVLATQVVLESLGKLALQGIDGRMQRQRFGLEKIRCAILAQEDEHHDFGQDELYRLTEKSDISFSTLRCLTMQYLELAFDILDEAESLFENLDSNSERFKQNLIKEMPAWLKITEAKP